MSNQAKPEKTYEEAFSELKNFILKSRMEENEPKSERERMLAELEYHYESSGFSDVHNKVLKDLTDKELENLYQKTFE